MAKTLDATPACLREDPCGGGTGPETSGCARLQS